MVDKIRKWLWVITAWAGLALMLAIAHDFYLLEQAAVKLEFAQWKHFLDEQNR